MPPNVFRTWGLWAVVTGTLALILVFAQIFGPTLEPTASVGTQIGEIAGDMRRAAWRSFFGLAQPEPEIVPVTYKDWLPLAAPVLGGIAIILSVISGVRGENRRFATYGTGLAVSAITFHFFWWVAVLIVGAMLLISIIENIGDIFSF
jgi:hypothetical protein